MPHAQFLTVLKRYRMETVRPTPARRLFTDLGITGPRPGALNDHIVSGHPVRHGRVWLYISAGDKGVLKASTALTVKTAQTHRRRDDAMPAGRQRALRSSRPAPETTLSPTSTQGTTSSPTTTPTTGDGWWTRITHHIDGGYLWLSLRLSQPSADRHLRPDGRIRRRFPLCGGVLYKEDAWPEKPIEAEPDLG